MSLVSDCLDFCDNDFGSWSCRESSCYYLGIITIVALFVLGTLVTQGVLGGGIARALPLFTASIIVSVAVFGKAAEINIKRFMETVW